MKELFSNPRKIKNKAHIYYRGLVIYPLMEEYPCRIKNCKHKKGNGRCGLREVHLEMDNDRELTDNCYMYEELKL